MPEWAVYGVLGGLAALENIFPPVPADTAVGVGAFLSHYGTVSALAVFAVVWSANVASAVAVYVGARAFGRGFFQGKMGRKLLAPAALQRIERLYDRHGSWGIFVSRFIPGIRAVIPPFAGVAGLGAGRALLPVAVASAMWYGGLTLVVVQLAGTIEEAIRVVSELSTLAVVVGLITGAVAVWLILRRRSSGRPGVSG